MDSADFLQVTIKLKHTSEEWRIPPMQSQNFFSLHVIELFQWKATCRFLKALDDLVPLKVDEMFQFQCIWKMKINPTESIRLRVIEILPSRFHSQSHYNFS